VGRRNVNPGPGCLVCVVDDDLSLRRALARLLRSAGYVAETFGDAESFLAFEQRPWAECLVLDVKMPGMGGIELLQQLREAGVTVPVIVISAMRSDEIQGAALASGAHAFFYKPFDAKGFLEAISRALGSSTATAKEEGIGIGVDEELLSRNG
jgi:FixJ family two-component response regulator